MRPSHALGVLLFAALLAPAFAQSNQSRWVHSDANGRLICTPLSDGNRIPDFSFAGYRGGGVTLPQVGARITVMPTGKPDDTATIQAALDTVSKLPLDANGQRGAVALAPGVFHLEGTLHMRVSGVVLRGSGNSSKSSTTLALTGQPHLAIDIKGEFHERQLDAPTVVTDAYIPAGATTIHVADASGIHPGETLAMVKPVTPQWTHFMGRDQLVRDGQPEVWVRNDIRVDRRVATVNGNAITLEVPLTDSFDAQFFGGIQPPVAAIEITGQVAEVGVEDLRIVAPNRTINYQHDPEFDGVQINDAVDSWLRSISFEDTTNSVAIDSRTARITVTHVDILQRSAVTSSAKPFDFSLSGSQILLDSCSAKGDKVWYIATQSRSEGPIVALHCRFSGDGAIEPHQRWSTGFLVDSCEVHGGSVEFKNRGIQGSGHGWTIGWSVSWNNTADYFLMQSPPGSANWSIGDRGHQRTAPMPGGYSDLPKGIIDSPNHPVAPASLYLEQLRERLGPSALSAIGY